MVSISIVDLEHDLAWGVITRLAFGGCGTTNVSSSSGIVSFCISSSDTSSCTNEESSYPSCGRASMIWTCEGRTNTPDSDPAFLSSKYCLPCDSRQIGTRRLSAWRDTHLHTAIVLASPFVVQLYAYPLTARKGSLPYKADNACACSYADSGEERDGAGSRSGHVFMPE